MKRTALIFVLFRFFFFRSNHNHHHFRGGFSKRRKSGQEITYLIKSRYPRLQIFHNVPIIRSRQVQVSVRETYPFQKDIQELCDIVSPDIQKNPKQRRDVEKTERWVRTRSSDAGQPQLQLNFGPKKGVSHLVSGTTSPSSTQAILVTAAPMFTTQAVDIPAPYVVAKDSY